jgi:hypothetical protein
MDIKKFISIPLALAVLWDGFTTLFGTFQILGDANQVASLLASILFSLLILIAMLVLPNFLSAEDDLRHFYKILLFILLVSATAYDLYTSYVGNRQFILGGNVENFSQHLILVGFTFFSSSSPVFLSLLIGQSK